LASFVVAAPELLATAAADVTGIGSSLTAASAAASAPTTLVIAAAGDEVSAAIATLFSDHPQHFQALNARAAEFHSDFVQALRSAAGSYAAAEAANASPLQTLEQDVLGVINAPTNTLLGRPLIGDGTSGATGTGQAGGAGGILVGNGGNGGSGAPGQSGGAARRRCAAGAWCNGSRFTEWAGHRRWSTDAAAPGATDRLDAVGPGVVAWLGLGRSGSGREFVAR
jgi:PE family